MDPRRVPPRAYKLTGGPRGSELPDASPGPRLSSSSRDRGALSSARAARAEEPLPLVHPLYVHLPDAPEDDALRRAFTAAAGRYRLHPVEVVDVPAPPAPRAPELLRAGVLNTQKIAFGEALHDLDAAAAEVVDDGRRRAVDRRAVRPLPEPRHRDRARRLERDRGRAADRGAHARLRGLPARRDARAGADAEHARDRRRRRSPTSRARSPRSASGRAAR